MTSKRRRRSTVSILLASAMMTALIGVGPAAANRGAGPADEQTDEQATDEVGFVADDSVSDGAAVWSGQVDGDETGNEEPDSGDQPQKPGLGDYGADGPITRDQLPVGLRDYVSDRSITLAASPAFASARAAWDESRDFVDQVDYQLSFRSRYDFLDDSPAHIASVLEAKPENTTGSEELSLYLTPTESAELARRDRLGDQIEDVERALTPRWGRVGTTVDVWQDQQNGGRITLFATRLEAIDRTRIERMVGQDNLNIVTVPHSPADYETYRDALSNQMQRTGLPYKIGNSRSSRSYRIEITVDDPTQLPAFIGQGVPRSAYLITAGAAPRPSGLPQDDHADADQQPGLMLWLNRPEGWGICTWGINGHTPNRNYVVTAGHCLGQTLWDSSGVVGNDLELWTGSAIENTLWDHLTPDNGTFLHSRLRTTFDVARADSLRADTNCFHGSSTDPGRDCAWQIESRAWHNTWETGADRTCASLGRSNTYRCGDIVDENVELSYGANWNNFTTERAVQVGFAVQSGDSGSGAKWNDTFDGMVICCTVNTYLITAYDIKRGLGSTFDFNCAVGFTRQAPGDWGACPGVNR